MSCIGIDRYCRPCKFKLVNDTKCCKNHQYLQEYTEEQLKNMIICTGCKKCFYSPWISQNSQYFFTKRIFFKKFRNRLFW